MKLSAKGLALIKDFEGYHDATNDGTGDCVAYLCPAKVWTLGFGATRGVKPGMRWTREQAEAALLSELATHEQAVDRLTTVPLSQEQFDALVSFSYNVGTGALSKSTLLRKLNAGDYDGAADEFPRWKKGGGRVLKGLVNRRRRERALFLEGTGVPTVPSPETAMAGGAEVDAVEHMAQSVQPAVKVPVKTIATMGGAAAGAAVSEAASPTLSWTDTMSALNAVPAWMADRWWLLIGVAAIVIVWRYLPSGRSA